MSSHSLTTGKPTGSPRAVYASSVKAQLLSSLVDHLGLVAGAGMLCT